MMKTMPCRWLPCVLFPAVLFSQIIPFDSNGLKYKALTRGGVTIMFARLPTQVRDFAILQVAVSNGSPVSWAIRPEDFRFEGDDGEIVQALPAHTVVNELLSHASRSDVSHLVKAYEAALYGNTQMHSTNGYEARREDALAEIGPNKLKAAAAASAIALVTTKLAPGQSTDGAVFYPHGRRPLGSGKVVADVAGEQFVFPIEVEQRSK